MSFQSFLWAVCSLSFSSFSFIPLFSLYIYIFFLYSLLYSLVILLYLKYLLFASSGSTLHLLHSVLYSNKPGLYRLYQQNEVSVFVLLSPSLQGHFRQSVSLNCRSPLLSRWLTLNNSPLPPASLLCPFRSRGVNSSLATKIGFLFYHCGFPIPCPHICHWFLCR